MTFHTLNTPRTTLSAQAILARLVRLTSKSSGLSAILLLQQYSSPLVINALLYLSNLRAKHRPGGGKNLAKAAEGWGKVAASVSETRIVMRLAGEFFSKVSLTIRYATHHPMVGGFTPQTDRFNATSSQDEIPLAFDPTEEYRPYHPSVESGSLLPCRTRLVAWL